MKYECWNILEIGTIKDVQSFRKIFKEKNICLTDGGGDLLDRINFDEKVYKLRLGLISTEELGFTGYATFGEVYKKAFSLGLKLCPAITAAYLRIHLWDQADDDFFRVASKPIVVYDKLHIFEIEHSFGKNWLNCSDAYPQLIFGSYSRLVWTLP